jgi:hypothetical protein
VDEEHAVSDRRDVLRSGLVVLGGAVGLSSLLGTPTAEAATTQRISADQVTGQVVGRQLDEAAQVGDTIVTNGRLINSLGVGTGRLYAVGTLMALADRFERPVVTTMEQHSLQLPQGSLFGTGTVNAEGIGRFAIVGGTGSYAGRRGSYTYTASVAGLGGDGTASFVLTLLG